MNLDSLINEEGDAQSSFLFFQMFHVKQSTEIITQNYNSIKENPKFHYHIARKKCENRLWDHVRLGMGYNFVHSSLYDLCDWVQSKWDPVKPKRKNLLVHVSRDSYKSTSLTQSFPSWALSKNPNLSILIASKVEPNAVNFLRVQKNRFEDQEFINIFGHWRCRRIWGDQSLTISDRKSWRKEASIMAAGIGSELTSTHWDVIIADDITTKKDMYSKAEREESKKFLRSLYDLADKRKCLILIVGTTWHQEDAIEELKKENKKKIRDNLEPYDIYYRPAEKFIDGEWKILWPFFTRKILDQIRADKADIRDYTANYRLMPMAPESQIFSEFHFFEFRLEELKARLEYIVFFIDPSLKDTKKADYSAIVVCGKRNDGRILVLDADIKRRKPTAMMNDLITIFKKYSGLENAKKNKIEIEMYMESVLFQEYLKDETINNALSKGVYLPLSGYSQTNNKIMRITGMEKYITSGQVLFREDWESQLNGYDILMSQLRNFPNDDHDDGPDALEGAISCIINSNFSIDFI